MSCTRKREKNCYAGGQETADKIDLGTHDDLVKYIP